MEITKNHNPNYDRPEAVVVAINAGQCLCGSPFSVESTLDSWYEEEIA